MGVRSTSQSNFEGQTSGFDNRNYSGAGPDHVGPEIAATGGTKATPGDGYTYHLFTSSGPFNLTSDGGGLAMDVLMVGGGGGGGYDRGGGGGAGGFLYIPQPAVASNTTITIGTGGQGGQSGPQKGTPGNDTIWNWPTGTITVGGGGGGGSDGAYPALDGNPGPGGGGGSGGGGFAFQGNFGDGVDNGPANSYSNNGFMGRNSPQASGGGGPTLNGGGGGGAGSGSNDLSPHNQGEAAGGTGRTLPWIPSAYGVPNGVHSPGALDGGGYFAGGGNGGGSDTIPTSNDPGPGGAGRGGSDSHSPGQGIDGTGAGGGGGAGGGPTPNRFGGDGGNGTVIIRYASSA